MVKASDSLDASQLVPMQVHHLAEISHIHQDIDPSPWSLQQWTSCCGNPLYQNWVVLQSDSVIAFACYISSGEELELLNIGVERSWQGQGIGEAMLKSSFLLLPESAEQCFLEVRRSNIPAISLYKKLGFEQISERKDYYRHSSGVIEDALIFRKSL